MTSITNMFPNFNDLTKTKTKTNHNTYDIHAYKKNKLANDLDSFSPALTQGDKFQQYQQKIKKNLEKRVNINNISGKEGFDNLDKLKLDKMKLDKNGLAVQSHNIITANESAAKQQNSTLVNLRQQYQNTLKQYNDLLTKYTGITTNYIKRTSSSNPYLGKNIRFSNGAIFYVTNQGIAKLYPSMDVYNSVNNINGCPASGYTSIDIEWNDSYYTNGTIIPANPDLLVGTPMVTGQSCGNEGKNVFVNTMVSTANTKYVGCYNNEPSPTTFNFAPIMNASNTVNGFTCSASSIYANDNANCGPWCVFDNNSSTFWSSNVDYIIGNTSTSYDQYTGVYIGTNNLQVISNSQTTTIKGEWIILACPNSYTLNSYSLLGRQDCCNNPNGRDPGTWYILGQNTGDSTWNQVDYQTNQSLDYKKGSYTISNPQSYNSYAILITIAGDVNAPAIAYSRNSIQIASWELFTTQSIQDSTTSAMIWNPNVIGWVTPEKCASYAAENGYKYYGLQSPKSDGTVACLVSQDSIRYQMYGDATNYTPFNLWSSYTNNGTSASLTSTGSFKVYNSSGAIVFETPSDVAPSTAYPDYVLVLQDDGNMCIYQSDGFNLNQLAIWCTMTNGKQQAANPNYVSTKGKYGVNFISSGSTLAPGDFVGSNNGSIYLMLQTDGNLVLNAFNYPTSLCSTNSTGTTVGADSINAVYELNQIGIPGNIGKLAYVDANANIYNYPSNDIKYGNTYSQISIGMDTPGNDIPGASYSNATLDSCQTTCNNNPDCAGIVTNAAGNICWPKTGSMYPYSSDLTTNSDRIIYIRDRTPSTTPIGVSNVTNNIDTVQYQQYINGGNLAAEYGLGNLTTAQQQQLQDIRSQLDLLSQEITNYTNNFGSNTETAEMQMAKNVKGLKGYLTDLTVTDSKIKNFNTNIDAILNDSDIVVLQKNYDYLFWTILAAGTVLVAINLIKK